MIITMVWIGFNCQGKIDTSQKILSKIGITRGVCVLLGVLKEKWGR